MTHLQSLLESFALKYAHTVTHLSTDWFLSSGWSPWFPVWSLFSSLQSLELRPYLSLRDFNTPRDSTLPTNEEMLASALNTLNNLVPSTTALFPSVKTLTLRVSFYDTVAHSVLYSGQLAARILGFFPNLSHLRLGHLWDPFLSRENVAGAAPILDKITSLSCLNYGCFTNNDLLSLLSSPLQLTRLEFCLAQTWNSNSTDFERICAKFASTLEVVVVTQTINVSDLSESYHTFLFPVLPRVKVLSIVGVLENEQHYHFVPGRYFKFQTGRPSLGRWIDYGAQFPGLTQFSMRFLRCKYNTSAEAEDDDYLFEKGIQLLYNFIPLVSRGQGSCQSVVWLDIPVPSGESWKYVLGQECPVHLGQERLREPCKCTEEVESSQFFKRVADTFPNGVMVNAQYNSRMTEAGEKKDAFNNWLFYLFLRRKWDI